MFRGNVAGEEMFACICISSLKNYLISLENLLHDQAFQHDGVMVYAIFFPNTVAQIAADFLKLQTLALASWRTHPW